MKLILSLLFCALLYSPAHAQINATWAQTTGMLRTYKSNPKATVDIQNKTLIIKLTGFNMTLEDMDGETFYDDSDYDMTFGIGLDDNLLAQSNPNINVPSGQKLDRTIRLKIKDEVFENSSFSYQKEVYIFISNWPDPESALTMMVSDISPLIEKQRNALKPQVANNSNKTNSPSRPQVPNNSRTRTQPSNNGTNTNHGVKEETPAYISLSDAQALGRTSAQNYFDDHASKIKTERSYIEGVRAGKNIYSLNSNQNISVNNKVNSTINSLSYSIGQEAQALANDEASSAASSFLSAETARFKANRNHYTVKQNANCNDIRHRTISPSSYVVQNLIRDYLSPFQADNYEIKYSDTDNAYDLFLDQPSIYHDDDKAYSLIKPSHKSYFKSAFLAELQTKINQVQINTYNNSAYEDGKNSTIISLKNDSFEDKLYSRVQSKLKSSAQDKLCSAYLSAYRSQRSQIDKAILDVSSISATSTTQGNNEKIIVSVSLSNNGLQDYNRSVYVKVISPDNKSVASTNKTILVQKLDSTRSSFTIEANLIPYFTMFGSNEFSIIVKNSSGSKISSTTISKSLSLYDFKQSLLNNEINGSQIEPMAEIILNEIARHWKKEAEGWSFSDTYDTKVNADAPLLVILHDRAQNDGSFKASLKRVFQSGKSSWFSNAVKDADNNKYYAIFHWWDTSDGRSFMKMYNYIMDNN